MKRIERALLKQLKVSNVLGIVQGNRLEDLASVRLWAAEKRTEMMGRDLPAYPCGEDLGEALVQAHLMYARLHPQQENKLVCPSCGEGNKGNIVNKKPWCIKCNVPLVSKEKIKKWMRGKTRVLTKEEFLKRQFKGLVRE